jgi:5-carboxymethyl-2-hydroxymuconate isomerase
MLTVSAAAVNARGTLRKKGRFACAKNRGREFSVMPHIIIEYSANVENEVSPQRLVEEMHAAAVASGIADIAGFRTRAERRDVYRVGDGNPSNGFVHIVARIRHGRSVEQRKALAASLMAAADKALEQAFAARPLALSVEVHEIDPETRLMRNTMREPAPGEKAA